METEWIEATEVRTKVPVEVLQAQRAGKGHFSLQCREAEEKLQNQPFLWNWALGNNCTCFASTSPSLRLCNQAPLQLSEQQLVWAISHGLILTQSWVFFYLCFFFFFFFNELWQAAQRLVRGVRGRIIFSCSSDRRRMRLYHSIHNTSLSWPR